MIALFEDIDAGSSIGCAALVPSPPFKRKQRRWNFSEGFIPVLDVVQSTSQARNTADLNCSGPNFEVQEESLIYDPAGNFFEPWDLPRLHPGRSTGSLPLENEGFLGLPPVQRKY